MMKQGKRIIAVLACIVAFSVMSAGPISAASYETKGYDVDIVVSEDDVLQVKETMSVDFTTPSRGIYRYIPYMGTMTYEYDSQVYEKPYTVDIKDIDVPGYEKDVSRENGNVLIRIGSEDVLLEDAVTYEMSYNAVVYEDRISEIDQIYWGLIPTDTPTATEKATFRIEMPKEFDATKVAFIAGRYGQSDSQAVDFHVDGNTIYGETNRILGAGEGVTLRVELPDGYFVGVANRDWMNTAMWILICLAPATTFLLWLFLGRDRKIVPTVEFYPPEGVSSAEIGYILDGASDDSDVISMVLYFADKGYLEIREEEKNSFLLIKKKELPQSAKTYEHTMFGGLFEKGDRVYLKELKGDFFKTFTAVRELLQSEFTDQKGTKVYTKGSKIARVFSMFLMINPLLAVGILGTSYLYQPAMFAVISIPLALMVFFGLSWIIYTYDKKDNTTLGAKVGGSIGGIVLTAVGLVGFAVGAAFMNLMLPMICAIVASLICAGFAVVMKQRTPYSVDMMGKILGFKQFISTAELDRLKLLVEETPQYFYHILPYAYVFGLTDKWAKNFEGIAVPQPSWYYSSYNGNLFTTYYFLHSFNHCTQAMRSNIAIPPMSEGGNAGGGGGGFSGGGFSGGGMGGGGMGSW